MASPHSKAYQYEKRLEKRYKAKRLIDQSSGDCDLISEEMSQAVLGAAKRGWKHLPIVVWREKNKKDDEAYIVIRTRDFEDYFI